MPKTKLPDNTELLKHYRDGLSDADIAKMYHCSVQAVNKRLSELGIQRHPYRNTAMAILEAAWPAAETNRPQYVGLYPGRQLFFYLRRRLGDPKLSTYQLSLARTFEERIRVGKLVLDLNAAHPKGPWVYLPREPRDGRMVIRWPKGREVPTGKARDALDLPAEPWTD